MQMTSLWAIRYVITPLVRFQNYLTIRKDGSFNRGLGEWLNPVVRPNSSPVDGVATFDAAVDSSPTAVPVRLFVPTSQGTETMPVMLYFHGGGFVLSRPDDALYDKFCRRLANHCHAIVVYVHYRRAPEHKFPAAYDDCYASLEWVRSSPQALPASADPSRIFLCGDSAGGNIVHHVGIRAKEMAALQGLVLIQPFFGGEERTPSERIDKFPLINVAILDWFWRSYLPEDADRDHPASHVFGSRCQELVDLDLPPMLVLVGGQDLLQDWEMRYVEEMKKAGQKVQLCFYEEAVHLCGHLNQVVVGDQMLTDIATWLHSHQG